MKADADVRHVIRELQWDPHVSDPDAISVAVQDGAVTLGGHAPTCAEKLAAVRAAERDFGVRAVADEIKVRLPDGQGTTLISPVQSHMSWNGIPRSPRARYTRRSEPDR
jgi:BON domain